MTGIQFVVRSLQHTFEHELNVSIDSPSLDRTRTRGVAHEIDEL